MKNNQDYPLSVRIAGGMFVIGIAAIFLSIVVKLIRWILGF